MHSAGRVSKREEKAFILIPLYKPCEKSLLYPIVEELLTGLWPFPTFALAPLKGLNTAQGS